MKNEIVWNKLAEEYDSLYAAQTDWRLGYSAVKELLEGVAGKKILDYGCGPGKFSRRLNALGAIVTGVDSSENATLKAREKGGNIAYRVVQNDDISFIEKESLDAAVANFVFCTMKTDEQIINISRQIYDKLKPNGYFVICDPHPDALGREYVSMKREKPEKIEHGAPVKVQLIGMTAQFYDYWRPTKEYIRILSDAGFKVDEIREPTIADCPDEKFWKDERTHPPHIIIRAKKVN